MGTTKVYITSGFVKDGEPHLRNTRELEQEFKSWRDCELVVTFEKAHAIRSLKANRYYWGVVIEHIAEHTGYTPDETHHVLKQMFLPKKMAVTKGNGEIVEELVIGGSTTKLNKIEFYDYCARIKLWALESLEVVIPDPDEDVTDTSERPDGQIE